MLLSGDTCTSDLITLGRTLMYHSIRTMLLGGQTCTSGLITLRSNLICLSILSYALRQIYLYRWFDHTWVELSATFHFDKRPYVDILEHVISSHLAGTKCITPIW